METVLKYLFQLEKNEVRLFLTESDWLDSEDCLW